MSTNQQERLAVETPEEREKLQRMSTNQQGRLAVETFEERERLQRISTNQQERLAVEIPKERKHSILCNYDYSGTCKLSCYNMKVWCKLF